MRWICFCCLFTLLTLAGCAGGRPQAGSNKQEAEVHYKLGISNLKANNPTLAMKELLLAEQKDPRNSSIHAALGQAFQLKGAYPEAEQQYLKALELSDKEPNFQNNLGALYLDMKKWDKAIEYFDKATSNLLFLSPYIALTGKGYAYFKKNDMANALQAYKEAISIAPAYAPAHYHLSEVYHEQGKEELEQRSLERAVAIAPQYAQAQYQLGVLLLKQHQDDEAKKHLNKVVDLAPDSELGMKATDLLRSLAQN